MEGRRYLCCSRLAPAFVGFSRKPLTMERESANLDQTQIVQPVRVLHFRRFPAGNRAGCLLPRCQDALRGE